MNRLTNVQAGKKVIISSVEGGRQAEMRLSEMGFSPGQKIDVLQHCAIGPLMVMVKGTKLALGHGLANKIFVEEG
jgi:Fe2+ transport system protein FeoA